VNDTDESNGDGDDQRSGGDSAHLQSASVDGGGGGEAVGMEIAVGDTDAGGPALDDDGIYGTSPTPPVACQQHLLWLGRGTLSSPGIPLSLAVD
jgi:hypothetical protein